MNEVLLTLEPWRQLARARGMALVLRILVVVSPMAAVACALLGGEPLAAGVFIAIAGVAGLLCAAAPDSHAGIALMLFIGVLWLALVDDIHTAWAMGAGTSLAVFHWSMAAAGATPAAARWTAAMTRRWTARGAVLLPAVAATWALVATLDRRTESAATVLVVALLALSGAAVWTQHHASPTADIRRVE